MCDKPLKISTSRIGGDALWNHSEMHPTPIGTATLQPSSKQRVLGRVWGNGTLVHCWREGGTLQRLWEAAWQFLQNEKGSYLMPQQSHFRVHAPKSRKQALEESHLLTRVQSLVHKSLNVETPWVSSDVDRAPLGHQAVSDRGRNEKMVAVATVCSWREAQQWGVGGC